MTGSARPPDARKAYPVTRVRASLIRQAESDNAKYPQYRGHWSGDAWKVGRVTRKLRTKFGVAFEPGDVVLFRTYTAEECADAPDRPKFVCAYSFRTRIDTSIRASAVEPWS